VRECVIYFNGMLLNGETTHTKKHPHSATGEISGNMKMIKEPLDLVQVSNALDHIS